MADAMNDAEVIPEDLYPIAILIDELRHEDVQCRLNSMRRLSTIAAALGPERTRNELVPYVTEGVDDEDEVLLAMAQQLGTFVPLVGGPEWAYVLLEPLEALAAMEESTVRDKAVASLNVIIAVLPLATVLSHAWPVLKRLAEKDWFTARTSACGLIARTYARVAGTPASTSAAQEGKEEHAGMEDAIQAAAAAAAAAGNTGPPPTPDDVLALYQRLCGPDEVPMVRRAACVHMADVGTALAGGRLPDPSAAHGHGDGDAEGGSSASDSKHEDSAARGPGGVSASTSSSTSSSAGSAGVVLQVDTGDVSAAAAPPAVPKPVTVSAATQDSGAKAATALMPLLTALMKDEQDSVRLLSVDNCVAAARLVNGGMDSVTTDAPPSSAAAAAQRLAKQPELRQQIMGLMLTLAADKSWRVRWSVANRLGEFAEAVGRAATSASLLPAFQALLTDAEAEVRTAAAYRVAEVGRLVGRDRLQAVILPCVNRLSEDVSEYVRGALATVVLSLAPVLGTDTTIAALLPLFLRLLKDSSAQVRLNIISKLEAVNAVIGLKMLSQALLPAIQELSADKQWRVRQAIIEFTPLLARQLGADFFDATPELVELCVRWLSDSVFAIREAAASNLKKLTEVFGPAWADRMLLPRVLALRSDPSFTIRLTALLAAATMGDAVGPALLSSRIMPALSALAADKVPNIRFNVAKALERLGPLADAATQAAVVRPLLAKLTADEEADVRYYAARALRALP